MKSCFNEVCDELAGEKQAGDYKSQSCLQAIDDLKSAAEALENINPKLAKLATKILVNVANKIASTEEDMPKSESHHAGYSYEGYKLCELIQADGSECGGQIVPDEFYDEEVEEAQELGINPPRQYATCDKCGVQYVHADEPILVVEDEPDKFWDDSRDPNGPWGESDPLGE